MTVNIFLNFVESGFHYPQSNANIFLEYKGLIIGRVKSLSLFKGVSYLLHYAWGDANSFCHKRTIRFIQNHFKFYSLILQSILSILIQSGCSCLKKCVTIVHGL